MNANKIWVSVIMFVVLILSFMSRLVNSPIYLV